MRRGKTVAVVAATIGVAVLVVVFLRVYLRSPSRPPAQVVNRIPKLQRIVVDQEKESAEAVARYVPKTESRLDDLSSSVDDLLRQLPGVVQVDVGVQAEKPTCRIIHLRDWHFVPKDLYAIDRKNAYRRELLTEEIDLLHQQLLLEVEAVQLEQMALLRCLIRHHGLKRIYSEGLTARVLPIFKEHVAALRDMEQNQITELRKQREEALELLKGIEERERTKSERYENAKKIEAEITGLLEQHKVRLLEIGVAGRLLMAGEIEEVLPLDDAELLNEAKPITEEGTFKLDQDKMNARRDAQVKTVIEKGGLGLIVLGGAHDLSDNVRRLGQGRCEYIRVTTRRFKEFAK